MSHRSSHYIELMRCLRSKSGNRLNTPDSTVFSVGTRQMIPPVSHRWTSRALILPIYLSASVRLNHMFTAPWGGSGLMNPQNQCATNAVIQLLRCNDVLWKALTGHGGKTRARQSPRLHKVQTWLFSIPTRVRAEDTLFAKPVLTDWDNSAK